MAAAAVVSASVGMAALAPISVHAQTLTLPSEVEAGGIAIISPRYEGSKQYEVTGFPIVAPVGMGKGDGVVQFKNIDDLRFRVIKLDGLEAGPLVGYRIGRDQSDGRLLRGLGDVDGGIVLGGYAGYRLGSLFPFVSYHHQVTGDDTGSIVRFGLESTNQITDRILLTTTGGATWASTAYTQSFFGVTTLQSSRSGLLAYQASSGVKDVFIGTSADIKLDDLWSLKLLARYAYLTGDATDSPVVETNNQFVGGIGFTYKFSLK